MRSAVVFCVLAMAGLSWGGPAAGTSRVEASQVPAQKAGTPPGKLPLPGGIDTLRIRALYLDGEFDPAIAQLEQARRQKRLRTRADSLFTFKYLAVMYAATYATVEKGKQYMVLLLTLEPTAGILDMQASDMIYMLFRNVQAEMAHARHNPDSGLVATPNRDSVATTPTGTRTARRKWPYWAAGSAALAVGAGAILYFALLEDEPEGGRKIQGGFR